VDMLRAMQRLDSADRARATALRKVLLSFWDAGVDQRFDKGIAAIKSPERVDLADVIRATEQLQPLQNNLRDALAALTADPAARVRAPGDVLAERRTKEGVNLARRLELSAAKLGDQIEALSDVHFRLQPLFKAAESKDANTSELQIRAPRVGAGEERVDRALDAVRDVQEDFTTALDGAKRGKTLPALTARLTTRAGQPLDQCVDECFPKAQRALKTFQADLEHGRPDAASAKAAREELGRLIDALRRAKDGLNGPPEFGELILMLSEIESDQRELIRRLHGLADALEDELLK
jgi:hypothetical protein